MSLQNSTINTPPAIGIHGSVDHAHTPSAQAATTHKSVDSVHGQAIAPLESAPTGPIRAPHITRDALLSLGLYLTPVALLLATCYFTGQRPWLEGPAKPHLAFLGPFFKHLNTWGLSALTLLVGVAEFLFGLYEKRWTKTERVTDIISFILPKIVIRPAIVWFTLWVLPFTFPGLKGTFSWVPFWWGFFIIAVADDLTQYWYHRIHHQLPILWRFHRTHHSAPYMGMAMASRQNIIYTIFFSQIYLTAALTYLGLGESALLVTGVKSLITLAAHSSIAWDKPFYRYKALHPIAWVLERLISTPATHHAHHADSDDDGIGHYKGNFGNMFFIWDVIFGTGLITRQYPSGFGIKHYKEEEWYAQLLWPIFKSRKEGSELSKNGPMVGDDPFYTQEHENKNISGTAPAIAGGSPVLQ